MIMFHLLSLSWYFEYNPITLGTRVNSLRKWLELVSDYLMGKKYLGNAVIIHKFDLLYDKIWLYLGIKLSYQFTSLLRYIMVQNLWSAEISFDNHADMCCMPCVCCCMESGKQLTRRRAWHR